MASASPGDVADRAYLVDRYGYSEDPAQLKVRLNAPIVPHATTVAASVHGFSLSIQHTHRLAQSTGQCVSYSADIIDASGQHTVTIVVPPKFDTDGHPKDECNPVADPWRTKPPKWEYLWKLPATVNGVQMPVHQALGYNNEDMQPYPAHGQAARLWPSWYIELHHLLKAGQRAVSRINTKAAGGQSVVGSLPGGGSSGKRGRSVSGAGVGDSGSEASSRGTKHARRSSMRQVNAAGAGSVPTVMYHGADPAAISGGGPGNEQRGAFSALFDEPAEISGFTEVCAVLEDAAASQLAAMQAEGLAVGRESVVAADSGSTRMAARGAAVSELGTAPAANGAAAHGGDARAGTAASGQGTAPSASGAAASAQAPSTDGGVAAGSQAVTPAASGAAGSSQAPSTDAGVAAGAQAVTPAASGAARSGQGHSGNGGAAMGAQAVTPAASGAAGSSQAPSTDAGVAASVGNSPNASQGSLPAGPAAPVVRRNPPRAGRPAGMEEPSSSLSTSVLEDSSSSESEVSSGLAGPSTPHSVAAEMAARLRRVQGLGGAQQKYTGMMPDDGALGANAGVGSEPSAGMAPGTQGPAGEGSAAAAAIGVLQGAGGLHTGMGSEPGAGVGGGEPGADTEMGEASAQLNQEPSASSLAALVEQLKAQLQEERAKNEKLMQILGIQCEVVNDSDPEDSEQCDIPVPGFIDVD